MNTSSNRPLGRPRSDQSRAALLDAAYWQITERGYADVTAEAIAKAAGAGKQTLYRWWPSKPRLVLEAFAAKLRERIDRPREAAIKAGDLEKFLIADVTALRSFAGALRGLIADAAVDAELMATLASEIFAPRAEALRSLLRDPKDGIVAEAIEGAIFRRLALGEALDEEFARRLARLFRS